MKTTTTSKGWTADQMRQWLSEQAHKAAMQAFRLQCENIYAAVYLYHKTGALMCATDKPEGFELSDARRIPINATTDQNQKRIYEIAYRLPVLPLESLPKP